MKNKNGNTASGFSLLAATMLIVPFFAFAHELETRAGTDDYLRDELGYTDDMLATGAHMEDREAFDYSTGEKIADDVLGDVLDRTGQTSTLQVPWADIEQVRLAKNPDLQAWDLSVTVGSEIDADASMKAQVLFYADIDSDAQNNAPDGIRAQTDREWSIDYSTEQDRWYADYKWYNAEADFWAYNIETTAIATISDNTFFLQIPFAELPEGIAPNWRVVIAVSKGDATQIDAAQDIGFPPVKGAAPAEGPANEQVESPVDLRLLVIAAGIGFIVIYAIRVARRRKAGPRA